jgi:hypothetical protein
LFLELSLLDAVQLVLAAAPFASSSMVHHPLQKSKGDDFTGCSCAGKGGEVGEEVNEILAISALFCRTKSSMRKLELERQFMSREQRPSTLSRVNSLAGNIVVV